MRTVPRRTVTHEQVSLLRAYEQRDRDWLREHGHLRDDDVLTRQATDDLIHAQLVVYPDPEEHRLHMQAEMLALEYGV